MYRTMPFRHEGPPRTIEEQGHHGALLATMVGGALALSLALGTWLCGALL